MTLPGVERPDGRKFRDVMWFAGLDPAVKVDNFGVVIHGLFPKADDGQVWNPFLREAFEIDHDSFTEIVQWIQSDLFAAYPPTYCIIDATRDTPTAEEMERKYGENTVKAMVMTNPLNYELKQVAYSFLTQGYEFPNTALLSDRRKAEAISEIQVQSLHERVEYTQNSQLKFLHPPGKHNDMNRSWEMSLKAVRDFQLGRIGSMSGHEDDPDGAETDPYDMRVASPLLAPGELGGSFAIP